MSADAAEASQKASWEPPLVQWLQAAVPSEKRVLISGGWLVKPWAPEATIVGERAFVAIGPNVYDWSRFLAGRVNCAGGRLLSKVRMIDRMREARDATLQFSSLKERLL